MSFLERAKNVAGQAAGIAGQAAGTAAKAGADLSTKAAHQAATTIRDPATKARAQAALRRAKRGFSTALERIDPGVLADVVIRATSLQEKANAKLRDKGSVYRISEIVIGASIPPSIQFTIARVDDPDAFVASDSSRLLAGTATPEAIVTLDGTTVDEADLEALEELEELKD